MKARLSVLVTAMILAACSATPSPLANATANRCAPAPGALLAAISQGLTVTGGGTLRDGSTVKSNAFSNVWMVAAEIDGPGLEGNGDIGIWATNDTSGAGAIYAVDAVAREFSDWGKGSATDADDGASEAKRCGR